jgi:hypothetical protein
LHSFTWFDFFFGRVQVVEAVKLFEYMNESGITPDQRSFELMISAHVVNRDIHSASATLAAMVSDINLQNGTVGELGAECAWECTWATPEDGVFQRELCV